MSKPIMGQIGEYRELDPQERQEYLMRLIEIPRKETAIIQKVGAKAIREMFNEALSCLEDGASWLERIDKQYEVLYPNDECKMPEHSFWWSVNDRIRALRDILRELESDGKYMPKEKEPGNIGGWSERMQQLIEAIGRHSSAEDDPEVADAVNAIQDALADR